MTGSEPTAWVAADVTADVTIDVTTDVTVLSAQINHLALVAASQTLPEVWDFFVLASSVITEILLSILLI